MASIQHANGQRTSGKYYFSLDIAKFVCALLIIAIHTRPFSECSDIIDFYFVDVIARIAVPLFFAISGYLFFGVLLYEDGKIANCAENRAKLLKYLKRIVIIYFGWSVVYFILQLTQWYHTGWWGKALIKDCIVSFFFNGLYYHLWYLLASIYAVPLLYIILSLIPAEKLRILIPVLWIGECLLYSYDWIGIDHIPELAWLTEHFPILFDAVFRALPLLGIGILCMECSTKQPRKPGFFAALSILLCAIEASILHFCTTNSGKYSYILFTPVMTFFILHALLCITKSGNPWMGALCRKSSVVIYCVHPLVLQLFELMGVEFRFLLWMLVTITSAFIAVAWVTTEKRIQKRKRDQRNLEDSITQERISNNLEYKDD